MINELGAEPEPRAKPVPLVCENRNHGNAGPLVRQAEPAQRYSVLRPGNGVRVPGIALLIQDLDQQRA